MRYRFANRLMLGCVLLVTIALLVAGCGKIDGDFNPNQPPTLSFVTVPLDSSEFSFAPVIYWAGNDPDGFVEYYSFADVTDTAAFIDPEGFYDLIPEDAWTDTIATQARIYLLTEAGEVAPHIFYIRCFDNEGQVNEGVVYRTFFRSNQPPNTPRIGITGTPEDSLSENVYVADTLFSAPNISDSWAGIQFNWRANDPDDQALYQIPLQYQPILVKAPNDTIFVGDWQDNQDIILVDLETGFYTLYVWSRDDGFLLSTAAARIEFNVIRPTFEHDILMVVEAPQGNGGLAAPKLDSLYSESGEGFYNRLFEDIADEITTANLELNGEDVRFFVASQLGQVDNRVPYSLIHQYKVVIFACDQILNQAIDSEYKIQRNRRLIDYLRVGGRLWYQGRSLGLEALPSNVDPQLGDLYSMLLEDFMSVDNIVSPAFFSPQMRAYAEFTGTRSGLIDYPSLAFDEAKQTENWGIGLADSLQYGQTGVERIERAGTSVTSQYFDSFTATYVGVAESDTAKVVTEVVLGALVQYPPTPTDCYIQTTYENVYPDSITRIFNRTLFELDSTFRADNPGNEDDSPYQNYDGEVITVNNNNIFVGHIQGQPWQVTDNLEVDYKFNPISDFHLKPVEVINERIQVRDLVLIELRYRTALSVFSYYFMEYDEVKAAWIQMLNWFLTPQVTLL